MLEKLFGNISRAIVGCILSLAIATVILGIGFGSAILCLTGIDPATLQVPIKQRNIVWT